ncbi:hypothetical protein Gasu2_04140 [Galdieria sulphuraria]|nr:hypothetical protein Gasu2_04140 [Galdieria sulphuraria]
MQQPSHKKSGMENSAKTIHPQFAVICWKKPKWAFRRTWEKIAFLFVVRMYREKLDTSTETCSWTKIKIER